MKKPYLKTENLSVGYQGIPLIQEIELSLSKGEIVTLIGPNGAGKSTILKSISKQLRLISGQVLFEDISIKNLSEKELARKTAIVFTERLSPDLITAGEVVALGRYPYTNGLGIQKEEDKRKVEEAMQLVQITDLAEREFSRLSDGQKQRVLLARAICQEPDLLLLDEPTSYLDVKYKLEFFSVLQQMTRQKKIGVLMSLHELDLAERISDKILCVKGDRIGRFGTPEEIFREGFIGQLYDIDHGSFEEQNGFVELERVTGQSEVFIIAGNHTGSFVFRELQRRGIPFSTGILSENDLDYPAAKALANKVIAGEAYEDFSEADYARAEEEMRSCGSLICCQRQFGTHNRLNQKLLEAAKAAGIPVSYRAEQEDNR
ncbi:ABC transporter ATP-binding protein [Hespellia stercorisuis]|uniref:Iron complex transport system ATP-binding protein n=1 Tax=Hespellia stercorisuis DSM 15480 TaxID=1121950 RepID=A0A1M6KIA1_9FIRM|nr:ABC transporter ATP-binding protein [Hespellia stercorisuis]SHJ58654.1 iron complex transport system ATP-binding protein [Hespellia stercorisuis DSM 15480]